MAMLAATNSAEQEESTTIVCFNEPHKSGVPLRKMLRQSHELTSQLLHVIVLGADQRPVVSDPISAKPVV